MVYLPKRFKIYVSNRKNKKYDVYENDKYLLSFGSSLFQQYFDKLGHYKHLNHGDLNRKRLYYLRHGVDTDKYTAKWFSHKYLW